MQRHMHTSRIGLPGSRASSPLFFQLGRPCLPCQLHRCLSKHPTHSPERLTPVSASAAASAGYLPTPGASQPDSAASPPESPFVHPRIKAFVDWWHIQSPQSANEDSSQPSNLKPLLQKIWTLCSPDKWLLAGATAFMVVAAMTELAIPHFATSSIFAASAQGATSANFQHYLNLLGFLVVVFGCSAALRGYCFSVLNNRMTMRLRSQLFKTLVESEASFFDANEVGTLTSRLQTDCQAITRCVATNLNIALRNGLQAFGGFVYLWVLSKELCFATVAITSILWGVTLVYGNFARRTQKVYQDVLACGNKVADEVLSLSRIVRTFSTEGQEAKRYNGWLGWLYQVALRQASGYSLFIVTSHIACYASKVVALVLGCAMVLKGTLTAEQLTNFIFYVEFVVYSSLNVCDEYTEFMEAVGASERVMKLLDAKPAAQIAPGRKLDSFSGHVALNDVVFHYPSRPNNIALDGVSITLQPGKRIALVGRSGSGKSSVVALLQRLYDPCGGAVTLDGSDLRELDADWFRSHVGVVSQDTRLFGSTVAANIAYGFSEQKLTGEDPQADPPLGQQQPDAGDSRALALETGVGNGCPHAEPLVDAAASNGSGASTSSTSNGSGSSSGGNGAAAAAAEGAGAWLEPASTFSTKDAQIPVLATQEQIEEAAREANAHDFIMSLPQGYDTPVNDKLLSGGQRQRIALARALIRKPNILILDEATSALDAESEAQVQVALDKAMRVQVWADVAAPPLRLMLLQGRTVVVIAHRLSTVRNADVIYVMDKGKVLEVGDHHSLMASRGLYWQLVVRQEYGMNPTAEGAPGAAATATSTVDGGDQDAVSQAITAAVAAAAVGSAAVSAGASAANGNSNAMMAAAAGAGVGFSMPFPSSVGGLHGSTSSMEIEAFEDAMLLTADSTLPDSISDALGVVDSRADNGTENWDHAIGTSLDSEDVSAALGGAHDML